MKIKPLTFYNFQQGQVFCEKFQSIFIMVGLIFVLSAILIFAFLKNSYAQDQSTSPADFKRLKEHVSRQLNLKKLKVYGGEIKGVLSNTISLITINGTFAIQISDETTILNQNTQEEVKTDDLDVEDFIVALGTIDNQKVMNAQTIYLSKDNKPQKTKQILVGQIIQIQDQIINIYNGNQKRILNLTYDDQSYFQNINKEQITPLNIDSGAVMIAIATKSEKSFKILKAQIIAADKSLKLPIASPSATTSAM